jgi:hypothetical protein
MENDNDDSPFEYDDLPQLPACSVRTLRLIAEEREFYRAGIAAHYCGSVPEHIFERGFASASFQWAIEDTIETARALSNHLAAGRQNLRGLIMSLN